MNKVIPSENTTVNLDRYKTAFTTPEVCHRLGHDMNGSGFIPCLNPSHAEKNPSMRVYDDHVHCYGCGSHLNTIGVIQQIQGYDYWGVVTWIANQKGWPAPRQDPEAQKRYEFVQSIAEIYAETFHDSLKNPEHAIAYLEKRGISPETTKDKVGWLRANYKPRDLDAAKRAGLISQKGNFLFADRLIIPITHHGQIVSLYGRALDDNRIPKHIYPGTTDPPMPATLWNLDACRGAKEIYLAESIIDAQTLIDRDFTNTIGLFGTQGLTDARLEALKKTGVEKITLCLDSDSNRAGQTAALKTGEKLFRAGFDVRILDLPLEPAQEKADVNSYFENHPTEDFNQLACRLFWLIRQVRTWSDVMHKS